MVTDGELLRQYASRRSEAAFAELVRRHLGMVHAAALRRAGGDAHRAEDVSQAVFADLARKAAALAGRPSLAGWLYIAAQRAAANAARADARRKERERKAQLMQEILVSPDTTDWERLRPVLDEALGRLGERDREAVLLRFFEGSAFADIGSAFGISPDAARMRVDRALDKLRSALSQRGVSSTAAALAAALGANAASAAPAALAAAVNAAAVSAAPAGLASSLIFAMNTTPVQVGIATAVLLVAGLAGIREVRANQALEARIASLQSQAAAIPALRAQYLELKRSERELQAQVQEGPAGASPAPAVKPPAKPIGTLAEAMAAAPVCEIDAVDQKPVAIDRAVPRYPFDLRRSGVTGQAVLDFVVAIDGGVVGAKVISATNGEIGQSALEAVSQWVYKPGKKGGQPVNVHMQMPVEFTLQK